MPGLPPGILIFEKRPRWEAELKRQMQSAGIIVRGCRTAGSALVEAATRPHSVLLLDLEAGPAFCLRLIGNVMEHRLQAWPIVIGSAAMADLEWAARELGALDFVSETIRGETLARLCRRQFEASGKPVAADDAMDALAEIRALE